VQHDVAAISRLLQDLDLYVTRHHQCGDDTTARAPHVGDRLEAAGAVAEAQVGDDHVRWLLPRLANRLPGVGSEARTGAPRGQDTGSDLAHHRLVLDDQDGSAVEQISAHSEDRG
jgi:hypothetical protein